MIAVTAYPIIDTIILSLQRASLDRPGQNKFIGLDNYGYVFKAHLFWMDLIHTAVITVVSVSIEFVLGMLLALAMHRVIFCARRCCARSRSCRTRSSRSSPRTRGSTPGRWTTAAGSRGCSGLSGDPLSHQFGTYVAIIMTEVWKNTPYMALLLLAGLSLVPDELLEAAKIDGASAWQRFIRITLPLMKPAILVALLFRTLDAFRIFDVIYIFSQGANNTASLSQLSYSTLLERLNLGLGSAVSVVLFVLVGIDRVRVHQGVRRCRQPGRGDGAMSITHKAAHRLVTGVRRRRRLSRWCRCSGC